MIEKLPLFKDFPEDEKNSKLVKWLKLEIYAPIARRINWLLDFFTTTDDGEGGEFAPGFGPVSYIDFDITYGDGQKEGRLQWNLEDGTLEVGMPGGSVNLQIGQEMLIRATNDEGAQIDNGSVVFISGATGANPLIQLADADTMDDSIVIGIATEDILDNQKGFVTTTGLVRDIDTSFCSEGDTLWLSSTAGEFTNIRPIAPVSQVVVGICIRSSSTEGVIYVVVDTIPRLDELSNVFTDGVHDLDLISWNTANERWENDANPWSDLRVSSSSVKVGAAINQPTWAQMLDDGAGSRGVFTYYFSPTADNEVFFSVQMSHEYKEGSDLNPHVHWSPDSTNTGDVRWVLEYTIVNVDGTFGNTALVILLDTADGIINKHQATPSGIIDGTGLTLSHMMICRLYRDANDIADTYTGNAGFLEFDIHYQKDTLGSRNEFSK